jgi:PST family polysaccharide transporter
MVMERTLPPRESPGERASYSQILRSTALIGGSSGLNMLVAIVRTKAVALLLGPAGIGLMGVYASITDLARGVAQMGINGSGVRQIAEAVASDDERRIARTVMVLRRTSLALALVGAFVLVAASRHVSVWAFGDDAHAAAVAWLSLALFFKIVSDSQTALIQGMRRIGDLARIGVASSLVGAVASVALVALMGERGVVPALVATAAVGLALSWRYSRSVGVAPVPLSRAEARSEAASLLKLGLAFMASGFLMMGAALLIRIIVLRQLGVEAAGFYHAAWAIGGLYVGVVLQAMGADFYPRLVGAITDKPRANRLVNEQAHVSLLLAGPGVVATLTFAGPVMTLFYTEAFHGAAGLLRWIGLGMALRVITWPMGYIIVAGNQRLVFFGTELAWTVVNIALTWACVDRFGLAGAGIAFFGSYVFHALLVYALVGRLTGFRWSAANRRTGLMYIAAVGAVFAAFLVLAPAWATTVGTLALLASCAHSARELLTLAPPESLPGALQRLHARVAGVRPAP